MMENVKELSVPEVIIEEQAEWKYLHSLFRNPDEDQWQWLHSEAAQLAWQLLAGKVKAELPMILPLPDDEEIYHQEYLSAFEVGAPTPYYPLIESHWNKTESVAKIIHENILFFKQFGLELLGSSTETADHLRYKLEFMRHLCNLILRSYKEDKDDDYKKQLFDGKTDYHARHLLSWLPSVVKMIPEAETAWFESWLLLLNSYVSALID